MGNGASRVPTAHLELGASGSRNVLEISRFTPQGRQQPFGKIRKKSFVPDPEITWIGVLATVIPRIGQPAGSDHAFRFLEKVESGPA